MPCGIPPKQRTPIRELGSPFSGLKFFIYLVNIKNDENCHKQNYQLVIKLRQDAAEINVRYLVYFWK